MHICAKAYFIFDQHSATRNDCTTHCRDSIKKKARRACGRGRPLVGSRASYGYLLWVSRESRARFFLLGYLNKVDLATSKVVMTLSRVPSLTSVAAWPIPQS